MTTGLGTPIASALAKGLMTQIPLDVAVSGSQIYQGSPSFSGEADYGGTGKAPPGVVVNTTAGLTCSEVEVGTSPPTPTQITPTLRAGSYTLVPSSCSGVTLSGVNAAHYVVRYTAAAGDFVVDPAPIDVVTVSGTQTYGGAAKFSGIVNAGNVPQGITVNVAGTDLQQGRDVDTDRSHPPGRFRHRRRVVV